MPVKHSLQPVALTAPERLQTLTENRRIFNLKNCELNVFETYDASYSIPLTFGDFVFTSMVRGKKIMHLSDRPAFEYLPGESVIVAANETMVIDFPDAASDQPTQCIALAVDAGYINNTLDYLNEFYNSSTDEINDWQLNFNEYHFQNDTDISDLINKLIRVCSSADGSKNVFADLNLKELLIRLLQSQHLQLLPTQGSDSNSNRLHFVLNYIQEHLTERIPVDILSRKAYLSRTIFFKWFREQFGITPLEYITRERIRLARRLLAEDSISPLNQISSQCGFTDVNYFVRAFRKSEGLTPGAYRLLCHNAAS